MCFKCVAEKMTEAELLRSYEFAQNNIGLSRAVGNDNAVRHFTEAMIVSKMVWQQRERQMLDQLNAGQSILMKHLKQKRNH